MLCPRPQVCETLPRRASVLHGPDLKSSCGLGDLERLDGVEGVFALSDKEAGPHRAHQAFGCLPLGAAEVVRERRGRKNQASSCGVPPDGTILQPLCDRPPHVGHNVARPCQHAVDVVLISRAARSRSSACRRSIRAGAKVQPLSFFPRHRRLHSSVRVSTLAQPASPLAPIEVHAGSP
jgi:hypothetical protein